MPGKKIPQDPKKEGATPNYLGAGNKPVPDVSPRPEAKEPIDVKLCEPDYRVARQEISAQTQLLDHVRMNVNGQVDDTNNSARPTTQQMRVYRRGE